MDSKPLSIDSYNNTKDSLSQNQTNQDSTTQHNTDSLILNPNNAQEYFEYSKQRQQQKDKGAIPEGTYYIDISQSKENKQSGIRTYDNTWYSLSRTKEGAKQWGKYNIPIYTDKDCTNTIESTTQREGFYIHGGESYGDNGGIDLAKEDTRFFKVLESIKEEYKEVLESIQDDKGRMVVKLEVGYGERKSEIDLRGKITPNGGVVEWITPNGGVVEWISQFDNGGGTACFDACKKILVNSGLSSNSASPITRFQVAKENKKLLQSTNQSEYLVIDVQTAKDGIAYLDSELESGYPVLVGVDYEFDRKIKLKNGKIDYPNKTDYTTDHYIVIVGRRYDEKNLYYLFYDVGTNSINEKQYKAGSNDNNRLFLQNDYSLRGQSQIPSKHFYVVTQIRRNIR